MYKRDKIILIIIIILLFITCFLYANEGLILYSNPYLLNYTIQNTHQEFILKPDYFIFFRDRIKNDYPGDYQHLIYYTYSKFCLYTDWQASGETITPLNVYDYLTYHSRMGIFLEAVYTAINHDNDRLCDFYIKLPCWLTYAYLPQSIVYVASKHEKRDSYTNTCFGNAMLFSCLITALSHSYPDQASLSKRMSSNLTDAYIYKQDKALFVCVPSNPNVTEKSPVDSGFPLKMLLSHIYIPIYSDIGGQEV